MQTLKTMHTTSQMRWTLLMRTKRRAMLPQLHHHCWAGLPHHVLPNQGLQEAEPQTALQLQLLLHLALLELRPKWHLLHELLRLPQLRHHRRRAEAWRAQLHLLHPHQPLTLRHSSACPPSYLQRHRSALATAQQMLLLAALPLHRLHFQRLRLHYQDCLPGRLPLEAATAPTSLLGAARGRALAALQARPPTSVA